MPGKLITKVFEEPMSKPDAMWLYYMGIVTQVSRAYSPGLFFVGRSEYDCIITLSSFPHVPVISWPGRANSREEGIPPLQ